MHGQRRAAASLLRQLLARSSAEPSAAAHQVEQQLRAAAANAGLGQGLPSLCRGFSTPPPPSVAPAATSVDISQEWYNRQRQNIPLGNRVPHTAVGVYISPSATIVGDVDMLERVSASVECGCVLGQVLLRSVGAATGADRGGAVHDASVADTATLPHHHSSLASHICAHKIRPVSGTTSSCVVT